MNSIHGSPDLLGAQAPLFVQAQAQAAQIPFIRNRQAKHQQESILLATLVRALKAGGASSSRRVS